MSVRDDVYPSFALEGTCHNVSVCFSFIDATLDLVIGLLKGEAPGKEITKGVWGIMLIFPHSNRADLPTCT